MEKLSAIACLMLLLEWICILIVSITVLISARLLWAWQHLRYHPHVEPIEVAKPSISKPLNNLVKQVASIAQVKTPPIYIRRASMPNAFILAGIFRPELFLSDELLEQCQSIEALEHVICHEIAHIQHADALPLGLLTMGLQCCQLLPLPFMTHYIQRRIDKIEQAADKQANHLLNSINRRKP